MQELRSFGSATFGPVANAHVIFDRNTGMSTGYGFLTFASKEAFTAAVNSVSNPIFLEGNYVNVQTISCQSECWRR
jgi:hypothetical protein